MKNKKILFGIIVLIVAIFVLTGKVDASGLRLKELEYDVTLNSDGTADVTEKWNIYIEDTNTLFKTFERDYSKYKEITDVSVKEVTNGAKKEFRQIYQEQYHVDKDCFYALVNSNNKFEIAWGVQIEDETKIYEISYTIVDAVKNCNDCSEFYWQFISKESEIPADIVRGTIRLPSSVSNIENFRVWAHGPLNGNIIKESGRVVNFEVEDLSTNTMLEVRVVTPTDIFYNNANKINVDKLTEILEEEQKWADEANAKRERIARMQKNIKIAFVLLNIIGILVDIWLIKKIIKYTKILKENPKAKPTQEIKYYRDIPDETATPAQAALLYYFGKSTFSTNVAKIVSASMLDLCLKKYIGFEVIANKKDEINVILNKEQDTEKLPEDEKLIYKMLLEVAASKDSFTMKEFKKYCEKNSIKVMEKFNKVEELAKKEQEKKKNYSSKLILKSGTWSLKGVGFLFWAIGSCFIGLWTIVIPLIILMIYAFRISGRFNRLLQKGIDEKEKWEGLKKYMEDFSMIDDKTVPELVLWEKYLVYATAFGIADKVLEQLKVIYPQISDTEYMSSHGYAYMYLMYSGGINNSFINSLNSTVKSTYDSINYSSGSGSGGGFSGGGGGRRRRWPEWAEDNYLEYINYKKVKEM